MKCKIFHYLAALAVALVEGGSAAWAQTSEPRLSQLALAGLTRHQHIPDEVLVQYRPGTTAAAKGRARGRVFGRFQENVVNGVWRGNGRGDLDLVKLPAGLTIAGAARLLEADPDVEFAEPNWVYQHNATSNDIYFTNGSLWGMSGASANPYGSGAATAWAKGQTGVNTVWVAIIDEGYMYTHPDLSANAGINPGEIAGNKKDDDGNGLVDDIYGWDFAANDSSVFDGVGDDHGTHVAGTIGAVGGNSIGVAGMCWNVKFISAKFLGSQGGTLASAIKAVNYVTDLKTRHNLNVVASNNSWGGGGYSQGLYDAIERANVANILFVAAAGNNSNNNDASASYPASYSNANVISVAAIDKNGGLASFSNYGATSVDLGAPGVGIWSTVPVSQKGKIVPSYASYNGTSMATPHVTGACALYKSINPSATAAQIKEAILKSVTFTDSLNGRTLTWGRLNVSGF
ncbi:MAG: S8 family peptidase [Verrucomicrobia bacterium]|nr:S8 family peptidase [Verrucomicrobiota bacterium]